MKKMFRVVAAIATVAAIAIMGTVTYYSSSLADSYSVEKGKSLDLNYPLVSAVKDSSEDIPAFQTGGRLNRIDFSLFGIIPIKEANLTEMNRDMLIPCGTPFGIKILTQGVMVVGLDSVDTDTGPVTPAKISGIEIGDVIQSINEIQVSSNQEIATMVAQSGGNPLSVKYTRNSEEKTTQLQPVFSQKDNAYKAGLWVRDSSAGIGTITYCDPDHQIFGGLGHPVCDVDTGMILPIGHGEIVSANISGVKKGKIGSPGELIGGFTTTQAIGILESNTESGVFGTLSESLCDHEALPIAFKQEIHTGKASIYTTVQGSSPKEYEVNIESIKTEEQTSHKDMIVKITDESLLEATGGIVQGMSGSPIIQDGKIVGAITHVFVNDPTKGYGIFIEDMLQASEINTLARTAS